MCTLVKFIILNTTPLLDISETKSLVLLMIIAYNRPFLSEPIISVIRNFNNSPNISNSLAFKSTYTLPPTHHSNLISNSTFTLHSLITNTVSCFAFPYTWGDGLFLITSIFIWLKIYLCFKVHLKYHLSRKISSFS